jgi:hypothetical protein
MVLSWPRAIWIWLRNRTAGECAGFAALFISIISAAATSYFNFYWDNDNLSVYVLSDVETPHWILSPAPTQTRTDGAPSKLSTTVLFTNAGRRSATVTRIYGKSQYGKVGYKSVCAREPLSNDVAWPNLLISRAQ